MAQSAQQGDKLNVFISYSRDDLAFADQLDAALGLAGFETTIDRHGILPGEDWQKRLGGLIRDADTVVFVLSPSSARSDICAWEVKEAVQLGKRVLPVLCLPLESTNPPQQLAELSYIFFYADPKSPGSGFGTGLVALASALNTDLDWLREHTRYLQRATEWEACRLEEMTMAYDMNAEGINGVQQTTVITVNVGGGGWIEPPPSPPVPNGNVLLFVGAGPQGGGTPNLAALQCIGNEMGPGVIGQAIGPFGLGVGGVGVAGLSQLNDDPVEALGLVITQTAGVFGQCDGGPGVLGKGGAAQNPPTDGGLSDSPINAGTGVVGRGGKAAEAVSNPIPGASPATLPALPAGAGVVGAAGGAAIHDERLPRMGVVGVGSPGEFGFDPGTGVVGFGGGASWSGKHFPSAGVAGLGADALTPSRGNGTDYLPAGIGVVGVGGTGATEDRPVLSEIEPAGAGVVGVAGGAPVPPWPFAPAQTPGVVGIGSPPAPHEFEPLMGGSGVLGMGAGSAFPIGEVVTNGPGVVGIGAPHQRIVGAGRGGVFGNVDINSNVAQIQLLPFLLKPPLPEFGSFGDLYLTLNPNPGPTGYNVLMFLCVRQNLPSSPGAPALWAPFVLGPIQIGGNPPAYP
jgi:hypothetical protein